MTRNDAPVRTALIGYGFAGRSFHAPLAIAAGLALEVVGSRDAGRVHADLPGVDVLADPIAVAQHPDVELVVIATPNPTHAALARAALEAGKHVVVDKPLTPTLAEARALAALATSTGRLLSVFQNRRWDSDFLAIREAIDAGRVGEAMHVESRIERFRPHVRDRWREQAGAASGVWWDLGPHLVDQVLQLWGRPDRIHAELAAQRAGATTDDWAHAVLHFGERRAILHAGMLAASPGARFVVHGTRGSLVKRGADRQEAQLLAGLRPGDDDWGVDPDPLLWRDGEGPMQALPTPRGDQATYYRLLADAIRGRGANPVPPMQALEVMAVLEAGARSAREGRPVVPDYD
ncbi:oxidoreductase [Marilutibacter spongiae]|uniref:Oxidoreductase n=1 Tax=Marilutibacter spongiae TaxID=2025720 RepID=A0A7W3TNL8_9GAMM|nr:oxidoreductase [Lysobacter spongiae]MBB1061491.1 oxidoreductase [Lysobacter spongiae]